MHLEEVGSLQVDVEYEWVPPLCHKCHSFGYVQSQFPTKEAWLPKAAAPFETEKTQNHDTISETILNASNATRGGIGNVSESEATNLKLGSSIAAVETVVASVDGNRTLATDQVQIEDID